MIVDRATAEASPVLNVDRLETLRDFLLGVGKFTGEKACPANKFDLEEWNAVYSRFSAKKWKGKKSEKPFTTKKRLTVKYYCKWTMSDEERVVHLVKPRTCQTAGCAIGWAATIPEFNKAGFYLALNDFDKGREFTQPVYFNEGMDRMPLLALKATAAFFGLTHNQACYLFLKDFYPENPTAKRVGHRITDFIIQKRYGD